MKIRRGNYKIIKFHRKNKTRWHKYDSSISYNTATNYLYIYRVVGYK